MFYPSEQATRRMSGATKVNKHRCIKQRQGSDRRTTIAYPAELGGGRPRKEGVDVEVVGMARYWRM